MQQADPDKLAWWLTAADPFQTETFWIKVMDYITRCVIKDKSALAVTGNKQTTISNGQKHKSWLITVAEKKSIRLFIFPLRTI